MGEKRGLRLPQRALGAVGNAVGVGRESGMIPASQRHDDFADCKPWEYGCQGRARRPFEQWRTALKWQRLGSYQTFAAMSVRHWDGIAAYCRPENKVALGFVGGLNNKIRVIQRCASGQRDEEYLRLKILTAMLPPL